MCNMDRLLWQEWQIQVNYGSWSPLHENWKNDPAQCWCDRTGEFKRIPAQWIQFIPGWAKRAHHLESRKARYKHLFFARKIERGWEYIFRIYHSRPRLWTWPENWETHQLYKYSMTNFEKPPFGFVLVFLLFSLLFLSNTYKLWFKTDSYYQDVYNSLLRSPVPFKQFFLRRLENRKRWEVEQKFFSILGMLAILGADVLVVMAFIK